MIIFAQKFNGQTKMKALDVAKYVVAKCDNVGDLITNKKLQKVLYYIKAWGVSYFPKDGVIDEDFEAWVHGPVCPIVYQDYKHFGYQPITLDYKDSNSSQFINQFKLKHQEDEKIEMIDVVFDKYEKLSSLQLEMLTHSEKPWINARKGLSPIDRGNKVISADDMRAFYKSK